MGEIQFLLIFSLLKTNSAAVKLYNTESRLSTQSDDFVYYTNLTVSAIQAVLFYIRTEESQPLFN